MPPGPKGFRGPTNTRATSGKGWSTEDRLFAIRNLLQVDLDNATSREREVTRSELKTSPSILTLTTSVKRWARTVSAICRLYADKCVEVHVGCREQDPASAAVSTIVGFLSFYLGVPEKHSLFSSQKWPDNNVVRDFILEVADAPVELNGGEQIVNPILPRWEPTSRFGRSLASTISSPLQDTRFLSVEESTAVLKDLEETFRDTLFGGLIALFSCAVLAVRPPDPGNRSTMKTLSDFEMLVGQLYDQALQNREHRVSKQKLEAISSQLDALEFAPRDYLEKASREKVAKFNKQHPRAALMSWFDLARNPLFKTSVRHRFARAAEKYRKSRP